MDKLTPARKSAIRPTYLSEDWLVELACLLILMRMRLKLDVLVFSAICRSCKAITPVIEIQ